MRIRSAIRTVTIAGVLATGSPSAQMSNPSIPATVSPSAGFADRAEVPEAGVNALLGVVLLTLATIRRPR